MERIKDIIGDDKSNVRVYLLKKKGYKGQYEAVAFPNALDQKIREREMRSEDMKRTDAYAKLSEEDQEALRLGREMLKNQSEEKKIYTMRRKKRNIRRIVALAAVLILVMAVGMTSIGGPERMLQFMKSSVGGRKVSQVDSSDKNKVIEEENEEKAYEKIGEEFGTESVQIIWRPKGMKFIKMELDTDIQVAELDYQYNKKRIEFLVSASYGEVAWGADNEDKKVEHYYYNQVKEANIEVTGYETPETERNRYVAEFEYNMLYYCLSGEIRKDEIFFFLRIRHPL